MKPQLYKIITKTTFKLPDDPGPSPSYPSYPKGENEPTYDIITTKWNTYNYTYRICCGVEETLKDQFIASVEYTYLCVMRGSYIGYLVVSVRDILYHILLRYGKINAHDLIENMKSLQIPLDTGSPIDLYFKQVEDCREFEVDVNDPSSGKTIVNSSLNAVQGTGLYKLSCKDFKSFKEVNKMWDNLKLFFQK